MALQRPVEKGGFGVLAQKIMSIKFTIEQLTTNTMYPKNSAKRNAIQRKYTTKI